MIATPPKPAIPYDAPCVINPEDHYGLMYRFCGIAVTNFGGEADEYICDFYPTLLRACQLYRPGLNYKPSTYIVAALRNRLRHLRDIRFKDYRNTRPIEGLDPSLLSREPDDTINTRDLVDLARKCDTVTVEEWDAISTLASGQTITAYASKAGKTRAAATETVHSARRKLAFWFWAHTGTGVGKKSNSKFRAVVNGVTVRVTLESTGDATHIYDPASRRLMVHPGNDPRTALAALLGGLLVAAGDEEDGESLGEDLAAVLTRMGWRHHSELDAG